MLTGRKINSHKQLNHANIKRFSKGFGVGEEIGVGDARAIYVFDIKNNIIEKRSVDRRKIGTERGFFSYDTEQYLAKWERGVASLLKEIDKWKAINENIDITNYEPLFKSFLTLLTIRSKKIVEQINAKNEIKQELIKRHPNAFMENVDNNALVGMFREIMTTDKKRLTEFEKQVLTVFDDYSIITLRNETRRSFCIAKCGFYSIKRKIAGKEEKLFVFPMDAKNAVVLISKDAKKYIENEQGEKIQVIKIKDPEIIRDYNQSCFQEELSQDAELVISRTERELIEIKDRNFFWYTWMRTEPNKTEADTAIYKIFKIFENITSKNNRPFYNAANFLREKEVFNTANYGYKEIANTEEQICPASRYFYKEKQNLDNKMRIKNYHKNIKVKNTITDMHDKQDSGRRKQKRDAKQRVIKEGLVEYLDTKDDFLNADMLNQNSKAY